MLHVTIEYNFKIVVVVVFLCYFVICTNTPPPSPVAESNSGNGGSNNTTTTNNVLECICASELVNAWKVNRGKFHSSHTISVCRMCRRMRSNHRQFSHLAHKKRQLFNEPSQQQIPFKTIIKWWIAKNIVTFDAEENQNHFAYYNWICFDKNDQTRPIMAF